MTADEKDPSTDDAVKVSVDDEELPEDLQPGEENPLAETADDDVDDDLLTQDVGHGHSRETSVDGEESRPDESTASDSADSHEEDDSEG